MAETADSRAAILDAAKRLFMQDGYRGISMRQIAEAVGVTKAALYYHFHDKEDLFIAIVEQYLLEMSALIDQVTALGSGAAGSGAAGSGAAGAGAREQVSELVRRILAQPPEQRSIIRLASQELGNIHPHHRARFLALYHDRFVGRITALLQMGMSRGELRTMDPNVATWSLLGMMYPYFHPTPPTQSAPTPALIDQLLQIYFDGMAAGA